jgi:hypothetical protein
VKHQGEKNIVVKGRGNIIGINLDAARNNLVRKNEVWTCQGKKTA